MIYPLVTDLAADGVPVAVTCRVLGFSKQGYYRWRANPVTERDWADAHLVNAARDIHDDDPAFGYRFIADELPEKGIMAGETRVQRLCRDHRIWSVFSKKRGLNRKPGPPVHDDLVERDFTARAQRTVADRYHRTPHRRGEALPLRSEGRLFREDRRVLDGLANEILAGHLRAGERSPGSPPGRDSGALGSRLPVPASPLHRNAPAPGADRLDGQGWCVRGQRRHGVVLLSAAEERAGPSAVANQAGTRLAITTWIERTYHRRRRQRRLGKLTPIECETINRTALTAA
jgi:putative transposase